VPVHDLLEPAAVDGRTLARELPQQEHGQVRADDAVEREVFRVARGEVQAIAAVGFLPPRGLVADAVQQAAFPVMNLQSNARE